MGTSYEERDIRARHARTSLYRSATRSSPKPRIFTPPLKTDILNSHDVSPPPSLSPSPTPTYQYQRLPTSQYARIISPKHHAIRRPAVKAAELVHIRHPHQAQRRRGGSEAVGWAGHLSVTHGKHRTTWAQGIRPGCHQERHAPMAYLGLVL